MTYRHLFGPVPSRRLGMSLGVDLVPKKICSLDCVYCEVGKTTKLTVDRDEYISAKSVMDELADYFKNHPDPDYITFSGSGEPTLNLKMKDILQFIKHNKLDIPVAVLTNGTLLSDRSVREAVIDADLVLPSLDAATQEVFEKINRPAAGLLIEDYISGLVDFRNEFQGPIQLEVFILPGYNDSESELLAIGQAIQKIKPDSVQLNTLDRPGTVPFLSRASENMLRRITDLWEFDNVEIISTAPERKKIESYRTDVESAIVETVSRRPCTPEDLTRILGLHINELNKYLDVLCFENKIESAEGDRGVFYQLTAK